MLWFKEVLEFPKIYGLGYWEVRSRKSIDRDRVIYKVKASKGLQSFRES